MSDSDYVEEEEKNKNKRGKKTRNNKKNQNKKRLVKTNPDIEKEIKILNRKRKKEKSENEKEEEEEEEKYMDIEEEPKKIIEIPQPNELFKNISKEINDIENYMINNLINYIKNDVIPNNSPNSYIKAYTIIVNIANYQYEQIDNLFLYYKKIIHEFIEYSYNIVKEKRNIELIDYFIKYTEKINFLIYWMVRIFTYLDRRGIRKKNYLNETLSSSALDIYKNNFFNFIKDDIYKILNKIIKNDRDGKIEERHKIKIILNLVYVLDFKYPLIVKENNRILWISQKNEKMINNLAYEDYWYNKYFTKDTNNYAKKKAKNDIQNLSASEYIVAQIKYLNEEKIREEEFINPIYYNRINSINYKFLIVENAKELGKMDTGIQHMFVTEKKDELKKVYELICFYPNNPDNKIPLEILISAFKDYIIKKGNEIYENKEITKDPRKFIPALIALKKNIDKLIEYCFKNNPIFQDTILNAFRFFMKKDIYGTQLSNYTDFCMKSGFKGKSPENINQILDEIIDLYKCLSCKLVFHSEADNKMSSRLIKNSSISINNEKLFITKLKQEAGINNISKMTQMIKDLELNKKIIDDYKLTGSNGIPNGIKFNIQIISESAWDINKNSILKIKIPKFLNYCVEDFENFYIMKNKSRKLIWCFGLSKIEIQYLCFTNKNISISTLPQFLVLLELEKYNKLTLEKISKLLDCDLKTILTDISGLVYNPSFNQNGQKDNGLILGTFNDKTKEFKGTDEIYFNNNFTCPRKKFLTLPLTKKLTEDEANQIEKDNLEIRKSYQNNILKATITRIMKSRKGRRTTHVWLINETSRQIDLFNAQPQQIKENIEKLIELNIIKRNDKDRTCYEYVA